MKNKNNFCLFLLFCVPFDVHTSTKIDFRYKWLMIIDYTINSWLTIMCNLIGHNYTSCINVKRT